MFEAADDKNPTVKENKLLQILGSSDLVTSDDKLFWYQYSYHYIYYYYYYYY